MIWPRRVFTRLLKESDQPAADFAVGAARAKEIKDFVFAVVEGAIILGVVIGMIAGAIFGAVFGIGAADKER